MLSKLLCLLRLLLLLLLLLLLPNCLTSSAGLRLAAPEAQTACPPVFSWRQNAPHGQRQARLDDDAADELCQLFGHEQR